MFSETERSIFEFKINGKEKAIDPIAAMRTLGTHGEIDLQRDIAVILASEDGENGEDHIPSREEMESLNLILDAARKAFGLSAFDSDDQANTYTDDEVGFILGKFLEYINTLKKKPVISPMSAPSTAAAS